MRPLLKRLLPSLAPLALSACLLPVPELENASVEGKWTVTAKNETDQCMFDNWVPGALASFEIVIEQFGENDREVTARLDGLLGFAFWVGVGTADLKGQIQGDQLSLSLLGVNNEMATNGCVFKREIRVTAQVDKDRLERGQITNIPRPIAAAPECEKFLRCQASQSFDGRRLGQ